MQIALNTHIMMMMTKAGAFGNAFQARKKKIPRCLIGGNQPTNQSAILVGIFPALGLSMQIRVVTYCQRDYGRKVRTEIRLKDAQIYDKSG